MGYTIWSNKFLFKDGVEEQNAGLELVKVDIILCIEH